MAKTNNTESPTPTLDTPDEVVTNPVANTKVKSNPPLERNYLPSPGSPWTLLYSEDISDTYVMEIKNVGVVIRTDSVGRNSISTVFIPNTTLAQVKQ